MFKMNRKENTNRNGLTKAIDQIQLNLEDHADPTSEDYHKMVDQLDKLYKMKLSDKPDRVKYDTWLAVGGNLAGLILIIRHEQFNVITSKALGFVMKSKIM